GGYEPQRRGQDIAELLQHLGPAPVLLVGWSLGVLDALAYVHMHGDARLAGLVLVDNSVGEDPPPSPVQHTAAHTRLLSREGRMHLFVRSMFAHPQSAAYLDRLTEACLRTPQDAAAALLNYPEPRSFWKEAVYATARPVLYIVTPRFAGQAENLRLHHPFAESVVMRGVGHALFVDAPGRFDTLLTDFIRRRVWH
ncbi:MAG TPA: alpha/beta hydrolase, partial [Acetobacteraceae bacterium]|nr:alpha/beta hydrolase [Acetobacteraceae bacterium]